MSKEIAYLTIVILFLFGGVFVFSQMPKKDALIKEPSKDEKLNINPTQEVAKQNTKQAELPTNMIKEGKMYSVILHTSEGDITIKLNASGTPVTANNFLYLAKKKFYNNTIFHRAIKTFMIQGGDPTGTGMGGPGYKFNDEKFTGDYTRGTVAMANSGPNTNGSQFFVMHADYPLPKNYTIFGHVVSGMETVDKIAESKVSAGGFGENSTPVVPTVIKSIDISTK